MGEPAYLFTQAPRENWIYYFLYLGVFLYDNIYPPNNFLMNTRFEFHRKMVTAYHLYEYR